MAELRAGMHDHGSIYPRLPSREPDDTARAIIAAYPEGDPWRMCWEFMLTHQLTDGEGAAFWHGATLALAAQPSPASPDTAADRSET